VLALSSPVLTDLSKIFWTSGIKALASFIFFSEISFLIFFMVLFISSFLTVLNPLFLLEFRRAFFADWVIGIDPILYYSLDFVNRVLYEI